jgi:hypothetical protein
MKIQYKQSDKDSRFLQPVGDGIIDVLDMAWTLSPKAARKEVPYVRLTEYQQTTGQLIASIVYYGRVAARLVNNGVTSVAQADRDPFDVYKYKYFAEPTGFTYKFPYFNTKKISRQNTFDDVSANPINDLAGMGAAMRSFPGVERGFNAYTEGISKIKSARDLMTGIANVILPGRVGFEMPKSWTDTTTESYTVTFDLFNTGTLEDVENNRNLCHLLSYQNSPSRRNFAIIDPPVIYSLTIPDVVHMPACWMSNLEITNLGNTRVKYLASSDGSTSVPRTIPEAYRITMEFTSLLMPSRNILLALDKGVSVEAISDITPFEPAIRNYANELVNFENLKRNSDGTPVNVMNINSRDRLTAAEGNLNEVFRLNN